MTKLIVMATSKENVRAKVLTLLDYIRPHPPYGYKKRIERFYNNM